MVHLILNVKMIYLLVLENINSFCQPFSKYFKSLLTIFNNCFRESLSVLNEADLMKLEKALCSSDGFEALVENSSTTTTCNEINVSTSENLTEETVKTKTNKKDLEFVSNQKLQTVCHNLFVHRYLPVALNHFH